MKDAPGADNLTLPVRQPVPDNRPRLERAMRRPDFQPTGLGKFMVFLSEAGAYDMEPKVAEISQKAKEYRETIDQLWEASYIDSAHEKRDSRWAASERAMKFWDKTAKKPEDFGVTADEVKVIAQAAQMAAKSITERYDTNQALKTKIEEAETIEFAKDVAALSLVLQRDVVPTQAKFISQDMGLLDNLYYAVNGHDKHGGKPIEDPNWDRWGDNDDNLRAHAAALVDGAAASRLLSRRVDALIDPHLYDPQKPYFKLNIRKEIRVSLLFGADGKYNIGGYTGDLERIESLADPDTQNLLQAVRPEVEKNIVVMKHGEIPNPLAELDARIRAAAERVNQTEKGTGQDLEVVDALEAQLQVIRELLTQDNTDAAEARKTLSPALLILNDFGEQLKKYSERLKARELMQAAFPDRKMTSNEIRFVTLNEEAFTTRAAYERLVPPGEIEAVESGEIAVILRYYGVDPEDPIIAGAVGGIRALIKGDPEGKRFEASKSGYAVLLGLIRLKIEPEVFRRKKHDLIVLGESDSPPQVNFADDSGMRASLLAVKGIEVDSPGRRKLRKTLSEFTAKLESL